MLDAFEQRLFERALHVPPERWGISFERDPESDFRQLMDMQQLLFEDRAGLSAEQFVARIIASDSTADVVAVIRGAQLPYVEWVLYRLHKQALEFQKKGRPAHARLAEFVLELAWEVRGTHEGRRPPEPRPDARPELSLPDVLSALKDVPGLLSKFLYLRSINATSDQAMLASGVEFFEVLSKNTGTLNKDNIDTQAALAFASGDPLSRLAARLRWMAWWHAQGKQQRVARHLKGLQRDILEGSQTRALHEMFYEVGQRCAALDMVGIAVGAYRAALDAPGAPEPSGSGIIWHGRAWWNIAKGLRRLNDSAGALRELQPVLGYPWHEALGPETAAQAHALKAEILTLLGLLHEDLRDYTSGRACYLAAADEAAAAGEMQAQFTGYIYAMASLAKAGLKRKAVREGYRILDSARRTLSPDLQVAALNNVAHMVWLAGNHDEAESMYREALELHRALGIRSPQEMHSLFALGDAEHDRGETANALRLYSEALESAKRIGELHFARLLFFNKLAAIPQVVDEKLLTTVMSAARHAQATSDLDTLQAALELVSAVLIEAGEAEAAIGVTRDLYQVATKTGADTPTRLHLWRMLADVLCKHGNDANRAEAFGLLWAARTRMLSQLQQPGQAPPVTTAGELRDVCERLLDLLLEHGDMLTMPDERGADELAFDVHEEAKSAHLLAGYAEAQLPAPPHVPVTLIERERGLLRQLRELTRPRDEFLFSRETNVVGRVERLRENLAALYQEIVTLAPEYVRLRQAEPATLSGFRALLAGREQTMSLVSYFCGATVTTIFEVAPGGALTTTQVRLGRDDIARCADLLQHTFDGNEAVFPPLAPLNGRRPWRRDLSFLDRLSGLVAFASRLAAPGPVCVSPDGPLRGIPLHALRCSDDGRFVAERVAVSYTPNVSSLLYIAARAPGTPAVRRGHAFVGSVPAAPENERGHGHDVAAFDDSSLLSEAGWEIVSVPSVDVTPAEVLHRMGSEQVIHLTCHGWFDQSDPLGSGLLLSDGATLPLRTLARESIQKRLGHLLTVRKIMDNDASVDLLTLRACSTARVAEAADPDERDGFVGALLLSGASSVIATLWDVDQTSSRCFLVEFYRRLIQDPSVPRWRAFWDAQRAMLERNHEPWFTHPYHWAGLVLTGEWR